MAPTETNDKPITRIFFEISFKTKGVVDSQFETIDELRVAMTEDFNEIYGEGNYSIDTLTPATPEQVAEIEKQVAELEAALADQEFDFDLTEPSPPDTIN